MCKFALRKCKNASFIRTIANQRDDGASFSVPFLFRNIQRKNPQFHNLNYKMKENKSGVELDSYVKASEGSNEEKQDILGVEGKYKWPIRIVSFIFFLATVGINYAIGYDTGKVSDKYSLYVTPPNLFFLIWAAIFSTMFFANLYNLVKNVWSFKSHIYLALTNLCLIIWISVFNVGNDAAVFVCFPILVMTVIIALMFWT